MIRLFKILFLCLVVFIGRVDANGADAVSIMNAASSKITGKSVSAAFTVSGSFSGRGTIKASGKKFAVETGSSSVWYDGKSMYTYSSGTGEVTVTIPSVDELAEINPLTYITGWRSMFTVTMAKNQPKSGYCIMLSPRKRGGTVSKAVVTMSSKHIVRKIVIKTRQGKTYSIAVTGFRTGISYPVSAFEFPRTKYKKAKIIDLR